MSKESRIPFEQMYNVQMTGMQLHHLCWFLWGTDFDNSATNCDSSVVYGAHELLESVRISYCAYCGKPLKGNKIFLQKEDWLTEYFCSKKHKRKFAGEEV